MHEDGLPNLLRLVERGVKVKATGFGRIDLDPTALMVGTDLPSTRASRPFHNDDFETIRQALDPEQAAAVFWNNAATFYLGDARSA